jgi:hypothetical protein
MIRGSSLYIPSLAMDVQILLQAIETQTDWIRKVGHASFDWGYLHSGGVGFRRADPSYGFDQRV